MIKYGSSFLSAAVLAAAFLGYRYMDAKEAPASRPASVTSAPHAPLIMRSTKAPLILAATASTWETQKELIKKEEELEDFELEEMYEETRAWIERDEDDFAETFELEVLKNPELDVKTSFYLVNAALRYSKRAHNFANAVLSLEPLPEHENSHHVGDHQSEKLAVLQIHTMSELKKRDLMSQTLANSLSKLIRTSSNLALVREGMSLLLKSGEATSRELEALVARRPKSERFAYEDLL